MRRSLRLSICLVLAASPAPLLGQVVAGPASVIDGDSLRVGGREVRLFGIDAPEGKQTCQRDGAAWACGGAAAAQLSGLVEGQDVRCEGRGMDQYGRILAICSAAGFELNRAMVEAGWATAFRRYSEDYIGVEAQAKAAHAGIWDSSFDLPEAWRAVREPGPRGPTPVPRPRPRAAGPQTASSCLIKGNRNRRGQWIYHLPGMPYYDATRAEEMFCSEAAAQAAGYRRALVR